MAAKRRDSAAEWKRESGIWHNWAEKHWSESGQNPFGQPRDKDAGVEPVRAETPEDPELRPGTP